MKKATIALLALLNAAVFAQNIFTDPRYGKKYKSIKKQLFFIITLFISGLTAIQAQYSVNPEEASRELIGTWEGSYSAGQGETGLTLTVYEEDGNYKAIFDFYNLPGRSNVANGKYYMNVSYNASTGKYFLKGYEWILRPNDYDFADLEGTLAENVFSGSTYNFRLVRINPANTGAEITKREVEAQSNINSREALIELVGTWEGSYSAGQGETGLTLTVYEKDGNYKAIFDFYNLPGRSNAAEGKYYMNVSYNPPTGKYSLEGYEWILRPNNYDFADLEGTLAENVFSGSTYNFRLVKNMEMGIVKRAEKAQAAFKQGTTAQQQSSEAAALFYLNQAAALEPSLAMEVASRSAEIFANITSRSAGTDARSDVVWRKHWIERLTKTEELFHRIFSNRKLPYALFYSTSIQQGKINYQTETINLNVSLNLRMNSDWISTLEIALQAVKAMDDGLQGTGKRRDWGLNDWPNNGVTKTNPFKNLYSGGGLSGTTRYGTEWKDDFLIVFELLNSNNRVIGRQSIKLSPFFEIYCNNRNYYGQFIEYGKHGGTIVDSGRAIRLRYEKDNIKTLTFNDIKISNTSDTMTVRIVSVNGKKPKNAGIQITPLSDSQWRAYDWREKQKPTIYFR